MAMTTDHESNDETESTANGTKNTLISKPVIFGCFCLILLLGIIAYVSIPILESETNFDIEAELAQSNITQLNHKTNKHNNGNNHITQPSEQHSNSKNKQHKRRRHKSTTTTATPSITTTTTTETTVATTNNPNYNFGITFDNSTAIKQYILDICSKNKENFNYTQFTLLNHSGLSVYKRNINVEKEYYQLNKKIDLSSKYATKNFDTIKKNDHSVRSSSLMNSLDMGVFPYDTKHKYMYCAVNKVGSSKIKSLYT